MIMVASDLASALTLLALDGVLLAFGKPPLAALLIVPFLVSAMRVFFMPAKSAAIPALVPTEMVLRANALSSAIQSAMPVIGLGFSAFVLANLYNLSPHYFYLSFVTLNALSFIASGLYCARLPRLLPDRTVGNAHVLADLRDGLAYIRSRRDLMVLTVLLTIFRLMVAPFFVIYLAANDKWFGGKPGTIMAFECAFTVGMLVAAALMTRARPLRPFLWFCNGLSIVGVCVAVMPFPPTVFGFVLWNVIAGLALPPADVPAITYLQLSVPDAYRGRVNSVRDMLSTGVMPIGMLLGGSLVGAIGLQWSFVAVGVGILASTAFGLSDRSFRSLRMPEASQAA